MIPQRKAEQFAHQTGSDLHVAQQDVVRLYALNTLKDADVLDDLIFKGGTYLRKMLLGNDGRFSEDLDFTDHGLDDNPEALLHAAFEDPHHGVTFEIIDPYATSQGNWACSVAYEHAWAQGRFKLEISSRERAFLEPVVKDPVHQIYFDALPYEPPKVHVCVERRPSRRSSEPSINAPRNETSTMSSNTLRKASKRASYACWRSVSSGTTAKHSIQTMSSDPSRMGEGTGLICATC